MCFFQITWRNESTFLFVNKVDLIDNPRFSVTKKKAFSQLTISNVQLSDQGWYECLINTDYTTLTMSPRLLLQGWPL